MLFDHRVPDRDTGSLRQVDVWINCKLMGTFPVSVLVNCKDHLRPLDVGEVETFMAEKRSTGAALGILYSRSGFTQNALTKARVNGVSCCRLFQDAPPDRPSEVLVDVFVAYPLYTLMVDRVGDQDPPSVLWRELPPVALGQDRSLFADVIASRCYHLLDASTQAGNRDLPCSIDWPESEGAPTFSLEFSLVWQWFRGSLNAFTLNGSFNAGDGSFRGSTKVGPFPLANLPDPGAWIPCSRPDDSQDRLQLSVTALAGPSAPGIALAMGDSSVFFGGPWQFSALPHLLQSSMLHMTMRFEHP